MDHNNRVAFQGSDRAKRLQLNPQWKKIRVDVLIRDRYRCQAKFPGCSMIATDVDHIDDDWENNDIRNLQGICKECHYKKSGELGRKNRTVYADNPSEISPGRITSSEDINNLAQENKGASFTKSWYSYVGEVWQKDENGKYILPERTIGYHAILWASQYLQHQGKPFILTGEQTRFVLWFYAIDEKGKWLNITAFKVAPKGWGKDPLAAFIAAVEFIGPCRFKSFNINGEIDAIDEPRSWVQVAAVSMSQNVNTFIYLAEIFSEKAIQQYQIELYSEIIYAFGRKRRIQAVSSSSRSLEGNFPTCVIASETHHWLKSNGCYRLWEVLDRNIEKVRNAHKIVITNAYDPAENSIAQIQIEAYEDYIQGRAKNPRIMMDFKGATDAAPILNIEDRIKVLKEVYGESSEWRDLESTALKFDDITQPVSDLLRFYYNSIGISKSSWVDIRNYDICAKIEEEIPRGSKIVMAFDGALNDDSTALTGMVVSGPYNKTIFKIGVWEAPPKNQRIPGEVYEHPREEIEEAINEAFKKYRIMAFWADPSHKKDDSGGNYWLPMINRLHLKYSQKIRNQYWASKSNAFNWDMTSSIRQKQFVEGLSALKQEITDNSIRIKKDKQLRNHVQNARVMKGVHGYTIGKPARQSPEKIDLAVCMGINYTAWILITGDKITAKHQIQDRG